MGGFPRRRGADRRRAQESQAHAETVRARRARCVWTKRHREGRGDPESPALPFFALATLRRKASMMLMTLLGASGSAFGFALAFFAPFFFAAIMSSNWACTGSATISGLQAFLR